MDFILFLKRVPVDPAHLEMARKLGLPTMENKIFRPVKFGKEGPVLSIQASAGHYCTPKKAFSDASQYFSFEVSLYDPRVVEVAATLGLETDANGDAKGWVPKAKVQELFDALVAKFGEAQVDLTEY